MKIDKKYYIEKKFNKNETIFKENDTCNSIGIIIKGKIVINSYLENGNVINYATLDKDDMFGNNLIFSKSNTYKGDVISLTDSIIYFIDKDKFFELLRHNTDFFYFFMDYESKITKSLNLRLKMAYFNSLKDRFINYLVINNKEITYDSISSLASFLFTTRENLSRLISKLVKEGFIIKENKHIILK